MTSYHTSILADARSFVSSKMGGHDMSNIPFDAIKAAVEKLYDGGWVAYERDFMRFNQTVNPKEEVYSPIRQRAIVEAMTKRRLGEYDNILKFDFDQNASATFIVSRASVIDRRHSRDVISERELTLYKFTRNPGVDWKVESVSIAEAVHEVHSRFGTINTPSREEDKADQFETCYRPGTHKSPLLGWVARLEMSWDQAYADDSPTEQVDP